MNRTLAQFAFVFAALWLNLAQISRPANAGGGIKPRVERGPSRAEPWVAINKNNPAREAGDRHSIFDITKSAAHSVGWISCTPINPGFRAARSTVGLMPPATSWVENVAGTFAPRPQTEHNLSWQKQTTSSLARLTSVHFTDAQHGWAAGSNGTVLKTDDGGATWERVTLPPEFSRDLLRAVWALDAQRVRLLGEYNLTQRPSSADLDARAFLLASDDAGSTWQNIEPARPPDKPFRRARRPIGQTAESEAEQVERLNSPILTAFCFAAGSGWLTGESGTIQTTRDGGGSWQMQYAVTRKLFYDVTALDAQQAWIVGGSGSILRTIDGGSNWNEQPSATTNTLRAVHFIDAKRGWAAGISGTILATTNGGNRWQVQTSNNTETLNDIRFVNAHEGWAAGERGTLLHTRDGGATWQDESLKTYASLNQLFFTAPDCGWVVGTNGSIYKYSSESSATRPALKSESR